MTTTTQQLLDRWKKAKGYANNSEAARALKVRPSAVSHWQTGTAHANPVSAARMATDLKLAVIDVLAAIEADRATDPEARRIWARYGKGAFMALVVGVSLSAPIKPISASAPGLVVDEASIMRNRRRNLRNDHAAA